jgi:hypothetical protein
MGKIYHILYGFQTHFKWIRSTFNGLYPKIYLIILISTLVGLSTLMDKKYIVLKITV